METALGASYRLRPWRTCRDRPDEGRTRGSVGACYPLATAEPDAEVRLAFQPGWPFQYHVSTDVAEDETTGIVYIAEAGQVNEAPYLPG